VFRNPYKNAENKRLTSEGCLQKNRIVPGRNPSFCP
jgi:hypothetical protein